MSMKRSKLKKEFAMEYERGMLRSAFRSIFWAVIADRKKRGRFTFQSLGKAVGADKAKVSHWFNGDPNWTINTIASLANALGLDLNISAVERSTGRIYTAAGLQSTQALPMGVVAKEENAPLPVRYLRFPDNSNTPPETKSVSVGL